MQRKALIGALKIVYTLTKQKIILSTKYEPVLELATSLGCDYLKHRSAKPSACYFIYESNDYSNNILV